MELCTLACHDLVKMQTIQTIFLIFILSLPACKNSGTETAGVTDIRKLWMSCRLDGVISFEVFNSAMEGYYQIDSIRKKDVITIIDYSKSSVEKRFFVVDIEKRQLLYKCLVAHGKNTGEDYAQSFSNQSESLKSCLGFFLTAETYYGKNGYSLKLDGLEKDINDNARNREIVIHGADYVCQQYIDKYGRIGRSWGCPALPLELSKEIIDKISNGSCLFIYGIDPLYKKNSIFLN